MYERGGPNISIFLLRRQRRQRGLSDSVYHSSMLAVAPKDIKRGD